MLHITVYKKHVALRKTFFAFVTLNELCWYIENKEGVSLHTIIEKCNGS